MSCCSEQLFERHPSPEIADIGQGGGAEYTVGRCKSCGAVLVHCWVGGVAGCIQVVSQDLIDSFLAAVPGSRKKLLGDWSIAYEPSTSEHVPGVCFGHLAGLCALREPGVFEVRRTEHLHGIHPLEVAIGFWLRELRTPELLVEVAQAHAALAKEISGERPLLKLATAENLESGHLGRALRDEEETKRRLDAAGRESQALG